jgi:hypothetical protein
MTNMYFPFNPPLVAKTRNPQKSTPPPQTPPRKKNGPLGCILLCFIASQDLFFLIVFVPRFLLHNT